MADELPPSNDDAEDPTRLDQSAQDPAWPDPDQTLPEFVDGYRVLRLIGRGGMGMVFEAEQQEPLRSVALKVLRGSAHTDEVQVRLFRREVETLARLRHPNIASIYGSGRLPDGRPYFAMELVAGPNLETYLNGRPSPANRDELIHRLSLLRKISEAVHYAHQRGVIHRDLKPHNIVVTEGFSTTSASSGTLPLPEIKILDFGLARITDNDTTASLMTDAGTIRGTLAYMSPEQARGDVAEIDVRSDVYALGVILYEMLAGDRPYDVRHAALAEAVRVICETPPRPLRDTLSGVRRVDPDLQTIALKALSKEAERRYSSAAAMAEDVERYLTSQPIMARPPSAAYQLRKLIARNRALFAALAVVLVVVVGASLVSTALYFRARTEAAKSKQVAAFLGDMITGVGPSVARGRDTVMLREVLDRTAQRVSTELAGQPEVAGDIHLLLGQTYHALGELEQAETSVNTALAFHRRVHGDHAPSVASGLSDLGTVKWVRGQLPEAEKLFREVLAMRRQLDAGNSEELGATLTDLGNVLVDQGRFDEAEPLLREGLAMKREVFGTEHAHLATSLNSLANLLHHRNKLDEAEPLYREALAMHKKLLGVDHPDVVVDVVNLGVLLQHKGDFDGAEASFREAITIDRKLYEGDHPSLASALDALGSVLRAKSDWAGAETALREVLEMNRRLHGDGTPLVAEALNSLAVVIGERRGAAAAEPMYREALAIHRRTLAAGSPPIMTELGNLAACLASQEKYEEAETLSKEALALRIANVGEEHPDTLLTENNLGRLYRSKGDLDAAEATFRKVLATRRKVLGENHTQVAVSMNDLAGVMRDRGRFAEAESLLADALVILDSSVGPKHAATLVTHGDHGRVLCDLGRCSEAESELRSSRDAVSAMYGPTHERTRKITVSLARAVAARGDAREAEMLFKSAVDAPAEASAEKYLAEPRGFYGAFLTQNGRFAEAEKQLLAAEKALRASRGAARAHATVLEALVALYERWAATEPGAGKSGNAARWRAVRERVPSDFRPRSDEQRP